MKAFADNSLEHIKKIGLDPLHFSINFCGRVIFDAKITNGSSLFLIPVEQCEKYKEDEIIQVDFYPFPVQFHEN